MLAPGVAQANLVTNGDFETGALSGWSTDTDGGGPPTPLSPDFQASTSPVISGTYSGRLEADYWSTPGNTGSTPQDQVTIANTLFQALTLTALPGQQFLLKFDWVFGGQETGTPDEDVQIGLVNGGNFYDASGNLSFLVTATSYGSGSFSGLLAPSYNNAGGWSLDFQLNAGNNGYGSYLLIDNVSLLAVPEPATLAIFTPALALLAGLRARHRSTPV